MLEIKQDGNSFYLGEESDKTAEIHFVPNGNNLIIVDHTFVSESLRGQKVGDALVKRIVEYAREEQLKILPLCPFAKSQFDRHSDYHDVLA
jgi:predicted GNAT family acetyltransferase